MVPGPVIASSLRLAHARSSLSVIVRVILLVLTAGVLTTRATALYAQQQPSVRLLPGTAAPSEAILLSGFGWPAAASLTARMYAGSSTTGPGADVIGVIPVESDGTFSVRGNVPRSLFGPSNRGNLAVVPGDYTIVVRHGTQQSVSVPFTVGPPERAGLLWGEAAFDTNGNGQRDADDVPAAAQVTVMRPADGSIIARANADFRGRYVLPTLPPGVYRLSVQSPFRSQTWVASTDATSQRGEVTQVDLLLKPTPADVSEARCFSETGFCITHDRFWEYFVDRGQVETFGYPVSRTVDLLGCATQFFQRHVFHQCGDGAVQRLNLLDPGLMPVNQINFSKFPPHDPVVATAAPQPAPPSYGEAVLAHVQATVPNTFEGLPIGFFDEFMSTIPESGGGPALDALVNLEIWGFPTSAPARDPSNHDFVYQRFQRGIMHYDHATGATGGILLGDWFKSVITGHDLPADLAGQMQGSRFLRQYCQGSHEWLCRPDALPDTDLSFAFEGTS